MAGTSGLSAHLTSVLCWTFLPSLFTSVLLGAFYRLSPSSRPTLPANASPPQLASANATAQKHFRRARITLVAGYLAYSILSVYWAQGGGVSRNYYALLGISREVVERDGAPAVKSHWRKLARVYHPDKVGKQGEQRFVELRKGVEVLENEGRRWAYERFGPGVTEWGKLVSNREFLVKGATQAAAFWLFAFLSIAVVTFFRKDERRNNFWRYLSLFLCLALEFHLLLRASPSPTFSFFFPSRLTYEHIALLRQLFISSSMAMSQLSPLLFPPSPLHLASSGSSEEQQAMARALADADALKPLLQRLAVLTASAEAEVVALQRLELRPLLLDVPPKKPSADSFEQQPTPEDLRAKERKVVGELKEQMVRTFEDLQIKSNPQTAPVWVEALRVERATREELKRKRSRVVNGEAPAHSLSSSKATAAEPASSLDAGSSPPLVTVNALASPPSSPPVGLPNSTVPLPSLSEVPTTSCSSLPTPKPPAAPATTLKPPSLPDASRLPSPPPEED
ncbi:hypothetical protein JCM1840_001582 [Sporobolomyces johnsonii]